jgi:hypothetical protein
LGAMAGTATERTMDVKKTMNADPNDEEDEEPWICAKCERPPEICECLWLCSMCGREDCICVLPF